MDGNDDNHNDGGGGKKRPNDGDYSGSPSKKPSFQNGMTKETIVLVFLIYVWNF